MRQQHRARDSAPFERVEEYAELVVLSIRPASFERSLREQRACLSRAIAMHVELSNFIVLLVDDDLRTTRRFAEMLREEGQTLEIARDGFAATSRLAREPSSNAVEIEFKVANATNHCGSIDVASKPAKSALRVTLPRHQEARAAP